MSRRYAFVNGWRWVGWFLRRGKLIAAFREAWLAYVQGYDSESCQECGRSYVLWHADDTLYGEVTGRWPRPWSDGSDRSEAATGQFCPGCFDRLADRNGITLMWTPQRFSDYRAAMDRLSPEQTEQAVLVSRPSVASPLPPAEEARHRRTSHGSGEGGRERALQAPPPDDRRGSGLRATDGRLPQREGLRAMTEHAHGGQPCDPSEAAAVAQWEKEEGQFSSLDAVLAHGAEPPEYPGLVLVPKSDLDRLRHARDLGLRRTRLRRKGWEALTDVPYSGPPDMSTFMAAIEAEAIEPLLALVRAAQAAFVAAEFPHGTDMSTWSKAEVERFWIDADTRWMEARKTFLALYAALPESVRVAARKPE